MAGEPQHTDRRVVVVGTGPSGAVAAKVLAERGVSVTVLESGTEEPRGALIRVAGNVVFRRLPNEHMTSAGGHRSELGNEIEWYQSITPGGLSNHWTSAVPRFDPADFDDGARVSEEYRWPLTYADLEPFYDRVEQDLVVTAGDRDLPQLPRSNARYRIELPADWRPIADAAAGRGHSLAPMPMAVGKRWIAQRRGIEFSSFHSIVKPLVAQDLVQLRVGAHVRSVTPGDETVRPSVTYRCRRTGATETVDADAVVLAAGALATTRILLASRSNDAPEGVGNSNGLLGCYLHDHPKSWWPCELGTPLTLPAHVIYMTRGRFETNEPMSGRSWTIGLANRRDRLLTYARRSGRQLGVQVFGTMVPRRSRNVTLLDTSDEFGDTRLGITYEYDDAAEQTITTAGDELRATFAQAGIDVEIPEEIPIDPPGASVHFGGTVRMHDDPDMGVLDRWNAVRDAPGIVVVDKSCFTTGPEKNPTVTMMALAARAADRLAARLTA